MSSARLAVVVVAFTSVAPSDVHAAGSAVNFAEPADPVFRALYPSIDSATGMTPVAEPAAARGRVPARSGRAGCAPGFRIAEPTVVKWEPGGDSVYVAVFLVTTDSPPGVAAACYDPEPWACVLERAADGWRPVDCARVAHDLFPGEVHLDGTRYRLSGTETAFSVSLRNETANRFGQTTDQAVVLFRFHERELSQVLAFPSLRVETDLTDGTECVRRLFLRTEPTQTLGFFDMNLKLVQKTGKEPCAIDPDPSGLYRWNGRRYVAR